MWIPINKTTGIAYPEITDDEKKAMESDPVTAGRYRFKKAPETEAKRITTPAANKPVNTTLKEPIEAKRVETTTADPVTDKAVEQ